MKGRVLTQLSLCDTTLPLEQVSDPGQHSNKDLLNKPQNQ